jgi:hypothetical protein
MERRAMRGHAVDQFVARGHREHQDRAGQGKRRRERQPDQPAYDAHGNREE